MSDNKSRDIFYGVVAIATLIVALIGATLAYFSLSVSSEEGAVNARAATVSINYEDGQHLIAQAERLIPSSFDVVKTLYERNLDAINEQAATEYDPNESPRNNLCQDGKDPNYDVCSVYRFSIWNDAETNINAILRTELNGFKDLAYAVRVIKGNDTDPNSQIKTGDWLVLDYDDNNEEVNYIKLKTCDNGTDEICYTDNGNGERSYASIATRPIFGFNSSTDTTFKTLTIAADKYTFDVVLFILENNMPQDYDQGKTFSGTIYVETASGEANQITGRLN